MLCLALWCSMAVFIFWVGIRFYNVLHTSFFGFTVLQRFPFDQWLPSVKDDDSSEIVEAGRRINFHLWCCASDTSWCSCTISNIYVISSAWFVFIYSYRWMKRCVLGKDVVGSAAVLTSVDFTSKLRYEAQMLLLWKCDKSSSRTHQWSTMRLLNSIEIIENRKTV